MIYQKIQLYLNTGLLDEFIATPDKSKLFLFSFNYDPSLWKEHDIIDNSLFCDSIGTLEIYKVFCVTPVSEIKFISLTETKSFKFDVATTNNPKIFTLSRTNSDEAGEIEYHIANKESHFKQNYQSPFLLDRSYLTTDTANAMIGDIGSVNGSVLMSRDFKLIATGDRYG